MSTLQLSLAIVGGLVLLAIIVHSAWTTRRNAPKQADPAAPDAPVEREPGERQEPGFVGGDELPGGVPEPALGSMPLPALERRPGLDALIDSIVPMSLEGLVSGDAALAALPPTRRAGSKPFAVEGRNEASGHWEMPVAGQRYRAFQAGVQLANRTGALNDIEYSEFVVKAQAFADAVNAAVDFPDMRDEVARARELDQFASDHDAQLAFVLRARGAAWSPGYIQQNAARLGFVPGTIPGRMALPAATPGMPAILALSFDTQAALAEDPAQSAIRDLTLSLDVAQVLRAEQPFQRLREISAELAGAMDGVVTDQNGQPLREEALDSIGMDLEKLYDTLDGRDLSAGSIQARRLFG
ncbi:cell division protein FtsZ [Xylophilus rhododendri]|uniref:Cell division protein FtsZ n=1 Tax=Xylophilus rhododendri TaxID=2697032 RepID=A0A857IZF6_9BURK|nr:cell division protein ZipA C-terminal FtsZ-binding domain-containing protein [Xylophilus rhododendri]QHI96687.1 cell division protein FtsZ [Xylophilus rhododendri]